MALTKCKECSASIADNAERCPVCGFVFTQANKKSWFEVLTSLSGPLVVSAAGTVLAYMTFVHQSETQQTQELQTMLESAVSNDAVKERMAVRLVSYLTKLNKLSPSFALSIFGTVARNGEDEKLRSEAYDAIENLLSEGSFDVAKFDRYDRLELFCLRAALARAQYWRQVNLHKIEQYSTENVVKYQAASKLLVLSQDVSNPQASIDLLLSLPIRLNNPDIIEQAIPILCRAVKERSSDGSGNDVAAYLSRVLLESVSSDREGLRSQIRLYLARALVTRDEAVHEASLKEIAGITASRADLVEDTVTLFDVIAKSVQDTDLRNAVESARTRLALLKEKSVSRVSERS
jgi:hypothetical protein